MSDTRTELTRQARKLFREKGFRETSVSDITGRAGIAVGSFYKFYPSKEQLFLEIFMEENIKAKKEVVAALDPQADPVTAVKTILSRLFTTMRQNPILREWYDRESFTKISRKCDLEAMSKENDEWSYDTFLGLIRGWQSRGLLRSDIGADTILSLINSLQFIDLHREDIGEESCPGIIDSLADLIVRGLMKKT